MSETSRRIDFICTSLERQKALKNLDAQALKKLFANRSDIAFEDFLLEEGIVGKKPLLQALEDYYKVGSLDIEGVLFEHHLVRMFPKDVMLRNTFIPYRRDQNILMVIAAHPTDPELPAIVGRFVSYDVTFFVSLARDIQDAVEDFYDESITERPLDKVPVDEIREEYEKKKILEED